MDPHGSDAYISFYTQKEENDTEKVVRVCVAVDLTSMWNIQLIRMAHRMPSRHREATSGSSQS